MRLQVQRAREGQRHRFGVGSDRTNNRMTRRQLGKHRPFDEEGRGLLKTAMKELGLSAREAVASEDSLATGHHQKETRRLPVKILTGSRRAQSVLVSVWRTCWQQGRCALDFLSQLLRGKQVAPALPP
jgi:hypothetical protein